MDAASTIVILIFFFSIIGTAFHGGDSGSDQLARTAIVYSSEINLPSPTYTAGATGAHIALMSFAKKFNVQLSADDRERVIRAIIRNCQEYDVNPRLIAALVARESGFRPEAVSATGALGLGQLMPSTAESLDVADAFNIEQNIRGTVRYIKLQLDRWAGEPEQVALALASYFQGYNAVRRRGGGYYVKTQAYIQDIIRLANTI